MMSELKQHYMYSIDVIMAGGGSVRVGKYRYTRDINTNLSTFIDELIDGYTPSEELQFVAKYLKSKYNMNMWRLKNETPGRRKKILN